MNYSDYPELAGRTEGEYAHLRELWAFGDLKQMRIHHAILGINTEAAELLEPDPGDEYTSQAELNLMFVKEVGDVLWYVSLLFGALYGPNTSAEFASRCREAQRISDTEGRANKVDVRRIAGIIDVTSNWLLKRMKNQMFYGTPLVDDELNARAGMILLSCTDLARAHGYTLLQVLELNIDKLRKRFPDGFNGVDAETKRHEQASALADAVRKLTPAEVSAIETTLTMIGEIHEGKSHDLSSLAGPFSKAFEKIDWQPAVGMCVSCPACGRTENGAWPIPCPSDDCPSHDKSGNLPSIPLS